jgi:hypothetical protein
MLRIITHLSCHDAIGTIAPMMARRIGKVGPHGGGAARQGGGACARGLSGAQLQRAAARSGHGGAPKPWLDKADLDAVAAKLLLFFCKKCCVRLKCVYALGAKTTWAFVRRPLCVFLPQTDKIRTKRTSVWGVFSCYLTPRLLHALVSILPSINFVCCAILIRLNLDCNTAPSFFRDMRSNNMRGLNNAKIYYRTREESLFCLQAL